MQPKVETASKPTKRFWANEMDDQCELKMKYEGNEEFFEQIGIGDGTFLEDISFEKWTNQNECCKKVKIKIEVMVDVKWKIYNIIFKREFTIIYALFYWLANYIPYLFLLFS